MQCFYTIFRHLFVIEFHYPTVAFTQHARTKEGHLYRRVWISVSNVTDINDVAATEFTHALVFESRRFYLATKGFVLCIISFHKAF